MNIVKINLEAYKYVVLNLPLVCHNSVLQHFNQNLFRKDVGCQCTFLIPCYLLKLMITRYFLFDAALISILGIIWQRQRQKARPMISSDVLLQQANFALDVSMEVLKHCSINNRVARQYWIILLHLKQSIDESLSLF